MSEIYQHLLTCTRRANMIDEINQEISDIWSTLLVNHPTPILNGSNPRISMQQVAVFLLTSESFRMRYAAEDPKKWKAFKLYIDDARSELCNQIKSHPMFKQVLLRANALQRVDPFEDDDTDEYDNQDDDQDDDQDNHNEDGGER
jgi:hypothetical protein